MSYHVWPRFQWRLNPLNATIKLTVDRQGLYDITHKVAAVVTEFGVIEGLVTIFIRHTSASLLLQENADPAVLDDLMNFFSTLVPEQVPEQVPESGVLYTHTAEGPDDMPAHIKSALTAVNLSIPLMAGKLALGTWQG
ncbi:MAG: secondary thiamine-phosphate synthase enzyme, partial [Candidatus Azotimanducaceae bacterium]